MTARETYLDVIKEQHTRALIDMCLSKYDSYQSNEEILNNIFALDVIPDMGIKFAKPFEKWTPSQMVNYIFLVTEEAMAVTTVALDNKPKNYEGGSDVKTG